MAQLFVDGIFAGAVFALVAQGFTLIWGVLNVINVAQGSFVMLGAYLAFWLFTLAHIDPLLGLPLVAASLFVLGYLLQRYLINLVVRAHMLVTFLLTFGVQIAVDTLALNAWTANQRSIVPAYASRSLDFTLGGSRLVLPVTGLAAVGVLALSTVILFLLLQRTRLGHAIRATGMDLEAARLSGVPVREVYAVTFGIGSAFAGIAGSLVGLMYTFSPVISDRYTLLAFVVSVIGGLGSVWGAVAGGLIFGLVEALGGAALGLNLNLLLAFAVMLVFLVVRPSGLFGARARA